MFTRSVTGNTFVSKRRSKTSIGNLPIWSEANIFRYETKTKLLDASTAVGECSSMITVRSFTLIFFFTGDRRVEEIIPARSSTSSI